MSLLTSLLLSASSLMLAQEPIPGTISRTMDGEFADLDGDGVAELIRAVEYEPNQVLHLTEEGYVASEIFLFPEENNDSEDIAVADYNGDGWLDIAIANEDTQIQELYLNTGESLINVSERLDFETTGDAVIAVDFDSDGDMDLVFSDHGAVHFLTNDGTAHFTFSREAGPGHDMATQDIEAGDVDGDGDLDLLLGSEGPNRLLINDGLGNFSAADVPAFALDDEETREADFIDVDGDGDLDVYFANVGFRAQAEEGRPDRLLINDGTGRFTDETAERLPGWSGHSIDVDPMDLDGDGDFDLAIAVVFGGASRTLINNGMGVFSEGQLLEDGSFQTVDVECVPDGGGLYLSGFLNQEDTIFEMSCVSPSP